MSLEEAVSRRLTIDQNQIKGTEIMARLVVLTSARAAISQGCRTALSTPSEKTVK